MRFRHEGVIGGKGEASDQFLHTLTGIAVDSQDFIYAVGDSTARVYDSKGTLKKSWVTSQPGFSITVDGQLIYVGEEGQIEIFEGDGSLRRSWKEPSLMGRVTAIGMVDRHVLVADSRARCIRRFDPSGSFLNNIGDANRMRGFNIPNGALDFAIDRHGVVHACNPGKHRVEQYRPGGELLGHIGRFDGRDPEGFPGCCNPTNVAVTNEGFLYVTEKAGPRAKVLDERGNLIGVIATTVFDPNCKNMDLAVDSKGRVYVADTVKLQINVFVPEE